MIRSQKEISEAQHPVETLSSTDKMMLRYAETRDWVSQNQKTLFYALGGVVVLIAGLIYYNSVRKTNNERANTLVTRVAGFYQNGDYRHAIDGDRNQKISGEPLIGLREIVSEYGSTQAGSQAALYLANSYYYLGKYDSALTMYEKVDGNYSLLRAAGEAGKAAVLEQQNKKLEAAQLFESAAKRDENNPLNADYILSAARDLQEAGKKDDAVRLYKKILADYPSTYFDDAAKRALISLDVEI